MAYQTTALGSSSDQQQQYRSYSSTYYNPDNHDQGPVSPIPSPQQTRRSRNNPASPAVRSSLEDPAGSDRRHGYAALNRRDSSPVPLVSPIASRRGSVASAHSSAVSGFTANTAMGPSTPHGVRPAPAYVAHSGAVQVVSDHRSATRQSSSDDEDVPKDDVRFSGAALTLVNSFLDELLHNVLSHARSTSLPPLKEAVTEVLKQRLARDAVSSAEGELRELLAGNEEDEEEEKTNTQHNAGESNSRWDLELVWKRTRLRVMVYMRLGEMEDEDEERYIKEEDMLQNGERRFSQSTGLVSWAAAIFLTSILEYVAEQTLQVAGNAAYRRVRRQSRTERSAGKTSHFVRPEPVTVEEHDVEKVALDPLLGRLWRTWRKTLRNTTAGPASTDRPFVNRDSEDNMATRGGLGNGLKNGMLPLHSHSKVERFEREPRPENVLASNIALPLGGRDVDEIELPGLARDAHAKEGTPPIPPKSERRRNSATFPYTLTAMEDLSTLEKGTSSTTPTASASKPPLMRRRSRSMPTPVSSPITSENMPGAFPKEEQPPENDKVLLGGPADRKERPEQKANAAEMAPHKRLSRLPKELLDIGASTGEAPLDIEHKSSGKSEENGFVAGVVAGATAAAAAAAAVVYGSSTAEKGQELPPAAPANGVGGHEEDFDRRKSLVGMKALAGTSSSTPAQGSSEASVSRSTSQRISPSRPVTPPAAASRARTESVDSYSLGGEQPGETPFAKRSPRKRVSMSGNMLTASTRIRDSMGMSATPDRTQTPSPGISEVEQQARSTSRPYLDNSLEPENAPTQSDVRMTESPTQSDFLQSREKSESRSMTEQDPRDSEEQTDIARPLQSVEQARQSLARPPGRRISVPGAALTGSSYQSPLEKSQHRQSWAASLDQLDQDGRPSPPRPWADRQYTVPASAVASWSDTRRNSLDLQSVQVRAAAVPRSGSRRNTLDVAAVQERWEPTHPTNGNSARLTSASIRGPEDFDMFVSEAMLNNEDEDEVLTAPAVPSTRSSLPAPQDQDARTGRSIASKQATSADAPRAVDESSLRHNRRSVSRPLTHNHNLHKSGRMAREPRVVTESTRDFADFIRSTGPDRETVITPLLSPANRSTTSLHSLRSAHINGSRASSVERSRSLTRNNVQAENIPPVPAMPATRASKSSLQPRGPTTLTDGNSDLIDFIRIGPDDPTGHRISRTVAPFRTTQDSDQLTEMGNRINGPGELDLSLNTNLGTVQSSKPVSKPTSSDSVIGSPSRPLGVLPDVHSPTGSELVRKQHRNKDPYAAYTQDLDDDNDEDETTTTLPNPHSRHQEEDLLGFLNSTGPNSSTNVRQTETSNLSDFLRTSSPRNTRRPLGQDEDSNSAPAPTVGNQSRSMSKLTKKGKGGGFFGGGGLGRFRSSVGASSASRKTYLDMP